MKTKPKTLTEAMAEIKARDKRISELIANMKTAAKVIEERQERIDDLRSGEKDLKDGLLVMEKIKSRLEEMLEPIKNLTPEDLEFVKEKMLNGGTERTFEIYRKMNLPEATPED